MFLFTKQTTKKCFFCEICFVVCRKGRFMGKLYERGDATQPDKVVAGRNLTRNA